MTIINLTYLLSDALTTEWMMTLEGCQALKQIYLDALNQKKTGSLRVSDIETLWAKHEADGLGETMHMLRDEEARAAVSTKPMEGSNYTSTYKNIAIIDIIGPIVPRVRGMSSGSIGAQQVRNDFLTAFESDDIKGILLNVDSPGGDARGISELAQIIQRARNKNTKPIYAYAAGWMASAAYFISAASHRIVANDWASVGSIGVVIGVPPKSPEDNIEFVSTASPYKRPDVSTDDGQKVYQDKADYMGMLFVEAVADLRGVPVEKVLSDFGKGNTLVGKQAKTAGLVDAIGTFDSTLHSLVTAKPFSGPSGKQENTGATADERNVSRRSEIMVKEFGAGGLLLYQKAVDAGLIDADSFEPVFSDRPKTSTLASLSDNGGSEMATQNDQTKTGENSGDANKTNVTDAGEKPSTDTGAAPKTDAAPPPVVAEESEEIKQLRARAAEADRLQAQLQEQLKVALGKDAETFAGDLVINKRILPATKEKVVSNYIQCASDDQVSPLASGSRVENFKGMFTDLPQHNLTSELMPADLPKGSQVLNPDSSDNEEQLAKAEASARRYAERQNPKPLAAVK